MRQEICASRVLGMLFGSHMAARNSVFMMHRGTVFSPEMQDPGIAVGRLNDWQDVSRAP